MKRNILSVAVIAASLGILGAPQESAAQGMGGGMGQGGMGQGGMMGQGGRAQPGASMTEGVVRKVDKDAGKITLKHGPIGNLDMPAMTMVFRVADQAMLQQVKPGDKVKFRAESIGGLLTVTKIEPAP
jgi:Cu/Ag efflux protein CusF